MTLKKMRDALLEAEALLRLCGPSAFRVAAVRSRSLPEDPAVLDLCERHGYGAVMDSAARQWRAKADAGEMPGSSHTTGPCVASVESGLKLIKAALKGHRR